jgi:heptosyltransferase-2
VRDLAGTTSLADLTAILASADGVVSNDSGAMHLAAATGAPVVAVFGATDETRTAPVRASLEYPEAMVVTTEAWCRPCMLRECPIDHRCMTGITAPRVADAVRTAATRRGDGRQADA